jgi:bacterioferritin
VKFPPASKNLVSLLNQAIAGEMQAIIQYMWQHVLWSGVSGYAVKDAFQEIAVEEMKHAEAIAERLQYMGGIPPVQPSPVTLGSNLSEMIAADIEIEVATITLYRQIVQAAAAENDTATRLLFEQILSDEEDHHNTFTTLSEGQAVGNLMAAMSNLPRRRSR